MNKKPNVSVSNGIASIDGQRIALRDIYITKVIDSGAHGTVFEGTEKALDRKVAVKVWYRKGGKVRAGAIGEVRKLASVVHPLFVTVYQLDVSASTPYSTMELLPGPSLKSWLRDKDFRRLPGVDLFLHLRTFQENLRQRCKFWFLYSAGLRHLYSRGMLHGDPHLGNVIVFDDLLGNTNHLVSRFISSKGPLSSIRILDLGTSLFRNDPSKIRVRESKVILESAVRLFPDFDPNEVMNLDTTLDPSAMLRVLDCFVDYVLELSNVPSMSRDDYAAFEHGFPQLLGWCPYFNFEFVSADLAALFAPQETEGLIIDALDQMLGHFADPTYELEQDALLKKKPPASDVIRRLNELSGRLRGPNWRFRSPNDD